MKIRAFQIAFYVISISLLAQLSINIGFDIPISGQTLAVLTGAMLLKPLDTLIGIIIYLGLGILGLPIFAEMSSGWNTFIGSSLGYFLGFIIAGYIISLWSNEKKVLKFGKLFLMQLLGNAIILYLGSLFLQRSLSLEDSIQYGIVPFIIGAIIKSVIGAGIVYLSTKGRLKS